MGALELVRITVTPRSVINPIHQPRERHAEKRLAAGRFQPSPRECNQMGSTIVA